MEEALKKLLESEVLDEGTRIALKEAWEKKLQEVQVEADKKAETKLREEFAHKFEHDKTELVEALDKFVGENVRKEMEEFVADRKGLVEERAKLAKAVIETRKGYKSKLAEHSQLLNRFVLEQLKKELGEFQVDRKELSEQKVKVAKQLREERLAYQKKTAERLNKFEQFAIRQLTNEINEFQADKKLLTETKARLVMESKNKLEEVRKAFVKRAATLVESTIDQTLRKEIVQLKDDLKVARENNFGRRIFEAFGTEYMTSYLAEGTKIKGAQKEIDALKAQLTEAVKRLEDKGKLLESTQRKVTLVEDQAVRTKILNDLLSPLSRDKKIVMEQMLTGVKTERLREQFKRYLDAVISADRKVTGRQNLAEASMTQSRMVVTGDRNNKLAESAKSEADDASAKSADIIELKRLAGLK